MGKLKKLRRISLGGVNGSEVTDAGIAYLKELPELSDFWGGSWYLTDKSLSYFANIKTLRMMQKLKIDISADTFKLLDLISINWGNIIEN